MEDIGDYLYIIVIALAAISGFFNKKPKKKEVAQLPEEEFEEYSDHSWNEPVSEELQQPAVETVKERVQRAVVSNRHVPLVATPTASPFSFIGDEEEEEEEGRPIELHLDDADEWKKGIVYAEIFNRKY